MSDDRPVLVSPNTSRSFQKQVSELGKKYRRLTHDLANAYAEIIENRKSACHAMRVPTFDNVWKYRIASSDMNRGQSGGFRVMAWYCEQNNTIYPFCVYTHDQYPKQPPASDVKAWLKEAVGLSVPSDSTPVAQMAMVCRFCGQVLTVMECEAFNDRCTHHRAAID